MPLRTLASVALQAGSPVKASLIDCSGFCGALRAA
jgi:hypothetical protein